MTEARTPRRRTPLSRLRKGDDGSAIILTMIVLAVLTGLGVTVFALSTNNLGNARRDRQASSALANSEAGVAQAISYIKNRGVGQLACAPNCNAANPWGESAADGDVHPSMQVTLSSQEVYSVWIETIQPLQPRVAGLYRVHSVGNSGTGPGSRTVAVDVQVTPFDFPLAVFADSIQAGGNGAITTESMFSTGCIFKRDKIRFADLNGDGIPDTDLVYGIPAAAHSSQYITDSQATGSSCAENDRDNIHAKVGGVDKPCNTNYPYDQDRQGGSLAGTSCLGPGGAYPQTSKIVNEADLRAKYGFNTAGLSPGQINQLRTAAQEQGFYFTNTSAIPLALKPSQQAMQHPNPVIFYEFASNHPTNDRLVDLNDLDPVAYGRPAQVSATSSSCTSRNVIVVVLNGDVRLNSNQTLVASVFVMGPSPYGEVRKANGTSQLIGTLYAKSIDFTGTANVDLDGCFLANLPGQLLNVKATNFREVDRPLPAVTPTP